MENLNRNNAPQPLSSLRRTVVERPYNPLYEGRIHTYVKPKFYQMRFKFTIIHLFITMCILILAYKRIEENNAPIKPKIDLSERAKAMNNRLLFDEDGHEIATIGSENDPHNGVDSVYVPPDFNDKNIKERGVYAANTHSNNSKYNSAKPTKRTILTDMDALKNSLVFAGSFVNKDNADRLVTHLKAMGYDKAEIVMKENLPYKVVVTGFYNHEKSAKKEVNALEKRGIEGYSTSYNLDEIYRKSNDKR
jgi:SPOR domain